MFTVLAFLASKFLGRYADDMNAEDRSNVAFLSDDEVRTAILHARQDIKFLCFLMFGVLVMLGVIADLIAYSVFFTRH